MAAGAEGPERIAARVRAKVKKRVREEISMEQLTNSFIAVPMSRAEMDGRSNPLAQPAGQRRRTQAEKDHGSSGGFRNGKGIDDLGIFGQDRSRLWCLLSVFRRTTYIMCLRHGTVGRRQQKEANQRACFQRDVHG